MHDGGERPPAAEGRSSWSEIGVGRPGCGGHSAGTTRPPPRSRASSPTAGAARKVDKHRRDPSHLRTCPRLTYVLLLHSAWTRAAIGRDRYGFSSKTLLIHRSTRMATPPWRIAWRRRVSGLCPFNPPSTIMEISAYAYFFHSHCIVRSSHLSGFPQYWQTGSIATVSPCSDAQLVVTPTNWTDHY